MDKNINPVAAFLVVLIAGTAIAIWFWCSGEAKEYGGPASMTVDPDGHLYIQIRNQLLEHDEHGAYIARHDLADLDVDVLLGGTAFFANGDILLRRGADTRTFFDTVRAYQRRTNEKSTQPDAPDTGLYRCDLDTQQCAIFGSPAIDFKSTFSVFIDRQTDDVYVSDSSRHLVRKYTSDGRQAAEPVGGFKFPNQLMLNDGQLLIADTNHHRIVAVRSDNDGFGTEFSRNDVVPSEARANEQSWPSHFLKVGETWWVNNMKTGMNYGGIYVFDDEWQYQREIKLPDDADPISLIAFNGEVLVSDWYGDRVHRLSTAGASLGDLASQGLSEIFEESNVERRRYMTLAWIAAAFAVALIAIIVVKGTDWTSSQPASSDGPSSVATDEPILLEPDPRNVKKIRTGMRMVRLLLIPLAAIFPALMIMSGDTRVIRDLTIGGLSFFIVYFIAEKMSRMNIATSIHIARDSVTLKNHKGREVQRPMSKVYYSNSIVTAGDIAVYFGQGNAPIYDKTSVTQELEERLPQSQRISEWAMQKKLIAMRHPQGIAAVIVLILAAVLALLMLR